MQTLDEVSEVPEEVWGNKKLPTFGWIQENCKSKSVAIRYLYKEYNMTVKEISTFLMLPYRHVYCVVTKMKQKEASLGVGRCCPVCGR